MKQPGKPDQASLPVLLEISLSVSRFILVFLALFVAGVSYLSGALPAQIFLRTGVSILILGTLAWVINWRLATGSLEAAFAEQQAARLPGEAPLAEVNPEAAMPEQIEGQAAGAQGQSAEAQIG